MSGGGFSVLTSPYGGGRVGAEGRGRGPHVAQRPPEAHRRPFGGAVVPAYGWVDLRRSDRLLRPRRVVGCGSLSLRVRVRVHARARNSTNRTCVRLPHGRLPSRTAVR
nr:MAG TPA: hypothetical protein [Caudoviricetes sp.]